MYLKLNSLTKKLFFKFLTLIFCGSFSLLSLPVAAQQRRITTDYLRYNNQTVQLDIYNLGNQRSPVVILIHGAAGISGDRAQRYRSFASDLMNSGIIAINVHYFQSQRPLWVETINKAVDYAAEIPNADPNKIGLIGYSLGGTIALSVAASNQRVSQLVVNSGYMPPGFSKQDASGLPPTYICAGTEDRAIDTLYQLQTWLTELGIPIETKINYGHGHSVPMHLFEQNWRDIVSHLNRAFRRRP